MTRADMDTFQIMLLSTYSRVLLNHTPSSSSGSLDPNWMGWELDGSSTEPHWSDWHGFQNILPPAGGGWKFVFTWRVNKTFQRQTSSTRPPCAYYILCTRGLAKVLNSTQFCSKITRWRYLTTRLSMLAGGGDVGLLLMWSSTLQTWNETLIIRSIYIRRQIFETSSVTLAILKMS